MRALAVVWTLAVVGLLLNSDPGTPPAWGMILVFAFFLLTGWILVGLVLGKTWALGLCALAVLVGLPVSIGDATVGRDPVHWYVVYEVAILPVLAALVWVVWMKTRPRPAP